MILRKMFRFACVGTVGTVIQYVTLGVGVAFGLGGAAVSSSIGYALGSVANYFLNYHITFGCTSAHGRAAAKYYTVLGVGLVLNGLLMTLFVHQLSWNPWVAQVLTTTLGLLWNFTGSHLWAFRSDKKPLPLTKFSA